MPKNKHWTYASESDPMYAGEKEEFSWNLAVYKDFDGRFTEATKVADIVSGNQGDAELFVRAGNAVNALPENVDPIEALRVLPDLIGAAQRAVRKPQKHVNDLAAVLDTIYTD